MHRSRLFPRTGATVVAAMVVTALGGTAASAVDVPLAPGVHPSSIDAAGFAGKLSPRLGHARGRVDAFIELAKKPAVDVFTAEQGKGSGKEKAKQAARAAKVDTADTVNSVIGQLEAADRGTTVLTRTANAVAGVTVNADAAKLRDLAKRPDVVSIRTVVPKIRSNASAAQLTNTLVSWQQTGKFGDGVRIGIIDDGIDYTHADFGGPGTAAAYQSIDRTKPTALFPNAKVVGGVDLAGDDYGAKPPTAPKPDANPLACGEHGTHVAGTAGGFGVNADGTTFTGDYRKLDAASLNAMKIGPGTAPKSLLYAIKVFGCTGSTKLTAQAMDWALDPDGDGDFTDHLDIVNLSLGSDFAAPDDPDSLFVRKLAANNVLPVIAQGNAGDLYDVAAAPGNTPEGLAVASSVDAGDLGDVAEVTAPATVTGSHVGQYSQAYTGYDTLDSTAPVVPLSVANSAGCTAYSAEDKTRVTGKFVWLEWDENDATRPCGSAVRAANAESAGAKGAVLSATSDHFAVAIAGTATLPMFQFAGSTVTRLRQALADGTLQVRLWGAGRASVPTTDESIVDGASAFTSRGVRGPALKPDLSAPGETIVSALRGSGDGRASFSGTSMATPHTSGIAALVRQAHPDWTVEEVKAALIGTAVHDITDHTGHTYAPQRVGSGRIDAKAALDNQVLAYVVDDPGVVSVNFGTVEAGGPVSLSKTIKLVNKGVTPVEYTVAYQAVNRLPGVEYIVDPPSVRLNPRGIATVKVTLKITDPQALRKIMDPTVAPIQAGVARQFVADASGRVAFTPRSGASVPLRVSVYAAPKPVSAITTPDAVKFDATDQAVLNLSGKGIDQGSGAQRYRSLVSVLELQAESPRLPACGTGTVSGCTLNRTAQSGDLRYIGAATTAPLAKVQGSPQDARLAFGLSTWSDWANLGSNTIPFVDIDTTGDGKPDFETFVNKAKSSDVLLATTVSLAADNKVVDVEAINGQLGDVDTNVFDTNVVLLPVRLTALGIDPNAASHRISYTVGVVGYYPAPGAEDGTIDSAGAPISFDPLAPGYWAQGGGDVALGYVAKPGTALVVNRDADSLTKDGALGLLVLAHHNAAGGRALAVGADPAPTVNRGTT
ncbi:S8 family serine peptidase [Amycolatopsis sp. NPDC059657]|uniref:S8 family serine peptidase n=1 Tax=Amycolatopsis sp. NPDC059657 TaxID=3346899 RepID=UPI0036730657